jgi:hypothetical protein
MSESKHTPGPWNIGTGESWDGAEELIIFDGDAPRAGYRVNAICKVSPMVSATDKDLSNAILIAAAPDLLEALQGILAVVNVRIDDPRCATFDAARAAVSKAIATVEIEDYK